MKNLPKIIFVLLILSMQGCAIIPPPASCEDSSNELYPVNPARLTPKQIAEVLELDDTATMVEPQEEIQ